MHPARVLLRMARSRPLPLEAETGNPPGTGAGSATGAIEELSEDEALLARMAVRDTNAFALLYDRHAALVFGTAVHLLGDSVTAERAVEEAFLTIRRQAAHLHDTRIAVRTRLLVSVCRYARAVKEAPDSADA
jgi:hypothetical protein